MSSATDLRKKSLADLKTELAKSQNDLAESRRSNAARELTNPAKIKYLRKEIARLHTVIAEVNQAAKKEKDNG